MKYNVLSYLIGEGFANIFKNKKQAITSFISMCLMMIFFGMCFMIVGNFNNFIKQIQNEQGIRAFIVNDATDEEIKELGEQIKKLEGVNTIEFISKEKALQSLKEKFGEKADLLNQYNDSNILPASYVIKLTDLKLTSNIQDELSKLKSIKKIKSSDDTINTLIKIARGVKIGSYVIIIALTIVSVAIISNIIKLTVYARRKEISIMKYVGATNSFIRLPFVVEGIIIGLFSGVISMGVVAGIYALLEQSVGFVSFLSTIGLSLIGFGEVFNIILVIYFILGIGIGVIGSTSSMRKYLKV